ncbi:spore germination protein [Acetonema longum]|uniref:GerA spore germination protein n=1 Tax=Acetonema longum DSM 6540 TaxID=1009370 RepID=F7NH67_9FIRM|nr:spore germination protein [Acetonema longum]EGO64550.1 GerA spore germination protein [Acetonema longum DSM 6540]
MKNPSRPKPKKLSAVSRQNSFFRLSEQLTLLRRLTHRSALLGEELAQLSAKFRRLTAAKDQPFAFTTNLSTNQHLLETLLRDSMDVRYRRFVSGGHNVLLVYLMGLIHSELLDETVIFPLITYNASLPLTPERAVSSVLSANAVSLPEQASDAIQMMMSGSVLLFLDGYAESIAIHIPKNAKRGINSSKIESVILGPSDAFNETLTDNIALIRRRTRDTNVKVRLLHLGERSHTSLALVYCANLIKPGLLEDVESRLKAIKIDLILYSNTLEEYLSSRTWSPFPEAQATERPDNVVASIYEGRLAILLDNTPNALIIPTTLHCHLQSADDYAGPALGASVIRITRYVAAFIGVYLPAIYISLVSYHPGMLPTSLAISIAELRVRTPFPSFIEAIIMEALLEILQEAITRLPEKLTGVVGVVGALVIGTTVVEAGLVNPLLVVIIATTAIASFAMPSYKFSVAIRLLRVPVLISGAVLGLYGVMISFLTILVFMCSMRPFGESYLGGLFDISSMADWKDLLIRAPAPLRTSRARRFGPQDPVRAGDPGDE